MSLFTTAFHSFQSNSPSHVLKNHFNIILPSEPSSASWTLAIRFPQQHFMNISTMRATCSAHIILLELMTRIMFGETHSAWRASCSTGGYRPPFRAFEKKLFGVLVPYKMDRNLVWKGIEMSPILGILRHMSFGRSRWMGPKGKRSPDSNKKRWTYANVTLHGPVVTKCTTRWRILKLRIMLIARIHVFSWISEQTAVIRLYRTGWFL